MNFQIQISTLRQTRLSTVKDQWVWVTYRVYKINICAIVVNALIPENTKEKCKIKFSV